MTKDKALKMAIDQLWSCSMLMNLDHSAYLYEDVIKAHDACKEALEQPKEQQYMYVYRMAGQHNVEFRFWDTKTDAPTYVGKIKLEVDDD